MSPPRGTRSSTTSSGPSPRRPSRRRHALAALAALLGLADASGARAEGASRIWTLSGTFRQIHASNILPLVENGPGDVIESPSVALSYLRIGPTTSISASASVYALRFGEQTEFNRTGGTFVLGGSHRFSRRVRLGFSAARNSGLAGESLSLSRTFFPQIDASGKRGMARLAYDISRTTIATVQVNGFTSHFSTSVEIPGLDLDPALVPPVSFPGLTETAPAGPSGPLAQIDPSLLALSILASEGLAVGESDFRLFGAGVGLSHSFSPVLTGIGWFGYSHVSVASSSTASTFEGGRVDASGTLSRQFDPSTRVSFSYSTERNGSRVPEVTNDAFVLQADRVLSANFKLDATFGYAVLASSRSSLGGTIVGGAGLTSRRGHNTLRARWDRTTFQAFGLGRNAISDVASVNIGRAVSRRLNAWLDGRFRDSHDPFDATFSVRSQVYGTGMSYRFRQRTHLGADYTLVRWTPSRSEQAVESSIWSVYVSYGKSFR